MKNYLFLLTVITMLICTAQTATAQSVNPDSLKARYDNETLHFIYGHLSRGQDGERIRHAEMEREFRLSPKVFTEYTIYKKRKTASLILLGVAATALTAGSLVYHNGTNKGLGRGIMFGGAFIEGFSLPLGISAFKHLHRAVWLRNRDVIFRDK